ncbi:MAG: SLBB domain-containing protein [Anaerohalosphaera sp.]|nr:SLBB domain-containing protein [Anaerohalosphaera sp.]
MNFAKSQSRGALRQYGFITFCVTVCCVLLSGCGDNVQLPTEQELAQFQSAGPIMPEIDLDLLMACQGRIKDYRISRDDLLEVLLPSNLIQLSTGITSGGLLSQSHLTRVDDEGKVSLPIVEGIDALGKTLSQLEAAIVAAYYPKYTSKKPSIVVRVSEQKTAQVSVTGAVAAPGIYELALHKMTLVSAIMAAGGIVENGAAVIHVNQPGDQSDWIRQEKLRNAQQPNTASDPKIAESRIHLSFQQVEPSGVGIVNVKDGEKLLYAEQIDVTDSDQRSEVVTRITLAHPDVPKGYITSRLCELAEIIQPGACSDKTSPQTALNIENTGIRPLNHPLLLPVKGMNIPFADISLAQGASVVIEPLDPQVFTVIGLVERPGVFQYPNNVKYNLLQAISFAGGVDEIANPRYVRVYRQKADGSVIDATFAMKDSIPTSAAALTIKPGDVVAIEQTPRTKMNLMIAEVFAFRVGAAASMNYLYYDGSDLRSGN